MSYQIVLTEIAERHLVEWGKSGRKKLVRKIFSLFEELKVHPATGTGQVEALKGNLSGYWSRRIDKANRMIYSIEDDKVIVTVVSLCGHYGDK